MGKTFAWVADARTVIVLAFFWLLVLLFLDAAALQPIVPFGTSRVGTQDWHVQTARRPASVAPQSTSAAHDFLRVSHNDASNAASQGTLVVAHTQGELGWIARVVGTSRPFKQVVVYPSTVSYRVGEKTELYAPREQQTELEKLGAHVEDVVEELVENIGGEAGKYLDFIVSHYDSFPDFVTFIHSHERSWHDPPDKVRALLAVRQSDLAEGIQFLSGYCLQAMPNDLVLWAWPHLLGSIYPEPFRYFTPCCAQFTVSKAAVLQRSKNFWIRVRNFVFGYNASTYKGANGAQWPDELGPNGAGYVLEWMWKPIFATPGVTGINFQELPDHFKTCKAVCPQVKMSQCQAPSHGKDIDFANTSNFNTQCLPPFSEVRMSHACQGYLRKDGDAMSMYANPNAKLLSAWGCHARQLHDNLKVDVLLSGDLRVLEGLRAVAFSVLEVARVPGRLRLHIAIERKHESVFRTAFMLSSSSNTRKFVSGASLTLHFLPSADLSSLLPQHKGSRREDWLGPSNFVRFFADRFLPEDADRCVWLDADVIVQRDVSDLADTLMAYPNLEVALAEYPGAQYGFTGHLALQEAILNQSWAAAHIGPDVLSRPIWNVGILALNVRLLRSGSLLRRVISWVRLNKEIQLYEGGGSQTPFNLAALVHPDEPEDTFLEVDAYWNCWWGFLGITEEALARCAVIHFAGASKPWMLNATGPGVQRWLRAKHGATILFGESPPHSRTA